MWIATAALFAAGLAFLGHARAQTADVDRTVDLMIDQAGTRCLYLGGSPWGLAVAPVDSIGVRFTVPQNEVFVLTDVEWSYGAVDPENPPVLSLGSDFAIHFWTPFLQLRGNSLIGNTLAGSEHLRTGIVVTSHDPTSAFCVVGTTQPASFNAQGYFAGVDEAPPNPPQKSMR